MEKVAKTNAMRILEREKIPCQMHRYNAEDGEIDGMSVARKTGRDPARVYKTLVARGASGGVLVFCIPVDAELDLKKAAKAAKEKSIAMLPVAALNETTGYVRGGVSPVGMKKNYPTFLSAEATKHESILVSGGRVGLQIEMAPQDLLRVCRAQLVDDIDADK